MALTREVIAEAWAPYSFTFSAQQLFGQLLGSNTQRRTAIIYVDPDAANAVFIADTEQHARNKNGAKINPDRGVEMPTTAPVYVFGTAGDTVYALEFIGQASDH